jgi:hypothetical protein
MFVSNQCGLNAIAEGLKVPRVLEVCPFSANVHPRGGIYATALFQKGFETNVEIIAAAVESEAFLDPVGAVAVVV